RSMADLYQTLVEERDTTPASTWWVSYQAVGGLVGVIDFLLIVSAYVSTAIAYKYFFLSQATSVEPDVGVGVIFGTIFVLLSRSLFRTHVLPSLFGQLRAVLFNWIMVLLIIFLIFFFLKVGPNNSRGPLLLFSVLSLGALVCSRFFICSRLSKAL